MLGELFDPNSELTVSEEVRPHWSHPGVIVFVTFRTYDSIPREVLDRWEREKHDWMARRGYPVDQHWSAVLQNIDEREQVAFHQQFNRCREDYLDNGRGRCLLRRPELARIVADALLHFDRSQYEMGDFVIMPNHVHLLAAFADADAMRKQFTSWLRFSAAKINKRIGERGHFWQREPFDHLVRNPDQYDYLKTYIAENPINAQLRKGEYLYRPYAD